MLLTVPMQTLTRESRQQLLDALDAYFDIDELKTLCFGLGTDWENLQGESKQGKGRELIRLCERMDLVELLRTECERRRPQVNWYSFIRYENESEPSSSVPRPRRWLRQKSVGVTLVVIIASAIAVTFSAFIVGVSSGMIHLPFLLSQLQSRTQSTIQAHPTTISSSVTAHLPSSQCHPAWFFYPDGQSFQGMCPTQDTLDFFVVGRDFANGKQFYLRNVVEDNTWSLIKVAPSHWTYEISTTDGNIPDPRLGQPTGVASEPYRIVWQHHRISESRRDWFFEDDQQVFYHCLGGGDGTCEQFVP